MFARMICLASQLLKSIAFELRVCTKITGENFDGDSSYACGTCSGDLVRRSPGPQILLTVKYF